MVKFTNKTLASDVSRPFDLKDQGHDHQFSNSTNNQTNNDADDDGTKNNMSPPPKYAYLRFRVTHYELTNSFECDNHKLGLYFQFLGTWLMF